MTSVDEEATGRPSPGAAAALERARAQLAAGHRQRAIRTGWDAANLAVRANDEPGLVAARELAAALRSGLEGRAEAHAAQLEAYCTHCLVSLRAGERRGSPFGRLFTWRTPRRTKNCPECAETVQAAARSCRFCGHRFDG